MLRCGLVLAGARQTIEAWSRGESVDLGDDGVVTAEEIAAANERLLAMNDPLALAAVIRGGATNEPITEERLRANRVPTLAVVGEIDPVKTSVDAMVGVMENLEVKVLPGKDHLTAVADPALAEAMRAFLLAHADS